MGKHRKATRRRTIVPLVTTGVALEVAGVLTAAYALNPTISDVGLAANHTIFVDGTKSVFLTDTGDPADRMRNSFDGRYDFAPADTPEFVQYPATLGLASILSNGPGAPTFDASEQVAVDDLVTRVKKDQTGATPSDTLYVVAYSQGGSAAVRAVKDLENTDEFDYDASKVVVIIAANPRRNDGGLLTRFPAFTLPLVGATFGEGTNPSQTRIIQVTKQYDGVADAPLYVLNVVADLNAVLGYVYLHGGYYRDVDIDPENPPADAIVTTSANGKVTDVLLPTRPGQLPLTRPLLALGVPQSVVTALDPFLRAVIETGYDRPVDGGVAPSQPVGFTLLPGPDQWARDAQAVTTGAAQSAQALATPAAPAAPVLTAARSGPPTDAVASTIAAEPAPSTTTPKPGSSATGSSAPNANVPTKFTPPRATAGGWQPGALLRGVRDAVAGAFGPTPQTAKPPTSTPTTGDQPTGTSTSGSVSGSASQSSAAS